jgi:hypothetical protein
MSAASAPAQRKADANVPAPAMPSRPRPTIHDLFGGVQRKAAGAEPDAAAVHESAQRGIATVASVLPHAETIQRAFGRHDISGIRAHTGADAAASAGAMGAKAYATGDHVVLGDGADLHTAAHEAAHVVQQRGGVQLKGGVGESGDKYERHADDVADLVVQRASAERLLDQYGASGNARLGTVQRVITADTGSETSDSTVGQKRKNAERDDSTSDSDVSHAGGGPKLPGVGEKQTQSEARQKKSKRDDRIGLEGKDRDKGKGKAKSDRESNVEGKSKSESETSSDSETDSEDEGEGLPFNAIDIYTCDLKMTPQIRYLMKKWVEKYGQQEDESGESGADRANGVLYLLSLREKALQLAEQIRNGQTKSLLLREQMRAYWKDKRYGAEVRQALQRTPDRGRDTPKEEVASDLYAQYAKQFAGEDMKDGCEKRAHEICQQINEKTDIGQDYLSKRWIFPIGGKLLNSWLHHVTAVVETDKGPYALDPLLGSAVPVAEWSRRVGHTAAGVRTVAAAWEILTTPAGNGQQSGLCLVP